MPKNGVAKIKLFLIDKHFEQNFSKKLNQIKKACLFLTITGFFSVLVESQGFEPWSGQGNDMPSTCLVSC
jgi:hypothetical protein